MRAHQPLDPLIGSEFVFRLLAHELRSCMKKFAEQIELFSRIGLTLNSLEAKRLCRVVMFAILKFAGEFYFVVVVSIYFSLILSSSELNLHATATKTDHTLYSSSVVVSMMKY